jgi:hypothetical protein
MRRGMRPTLSSSDGGCHAELGKCRITQEPESPVQTKYRRIKDFNGEWKERRLRTSVAKMRGPNGNHINKQGCWPH